MHVFYNVTYVITVPQMQPEQQQCSVVNYGCSDCRHCLLLTQLRRNMGRKYGNIGI